MSWCKLLSAVIVASLAFSPTAAGAGEWGAGFAQQTPVDETVELSELDFASAVEAWDADAKSVPSGIDLTSFDSPLIVRGQSAEGSGDHSDLAALAQNPIANLAAFPLQSNWNFGNGAANRTQYVGNFQPVVPWKLGEDWTLISRMIVPFVNTPVGLDSDTRGLGDSQGQFFFSPKADGHFIWGAGPMVIYPTASDPALGFGEWAYGVDAVGLISTGKIVSGVLMTQAWGIDSNTAPFLLQPFFNYNFHGGYFINVSGEATADWEVPDASRWSFPLGAGVGRTFPLAGQPLTLSTRFAPYLEAPPGGPDWQFRFVVSFLFPK